MRWRLPRRSIASSWSGYTAAQLFAPGSDSVVGIEPMSAPTDALHRGNYRMAAPGSPETATFSINVS